MGAAVVLKGTPYFFGILLVLAGCAAGSSAVLRDCRRRSRPSWSTTEASLQEVLETEASSFRSVQLGWCAHTQ